MKKEPVFHYIHNQWQPFASPPSTQPLDHITIASYNVLCSNFWLERLISSDRTRFRYQIDTLLPSIDADILSLNEVSSDYIELLLKAEWAQKYYVYNPKKPFFRAKTGSLILSKFPMSCYSMDEIIPGRIALGSMEIDQESCFILVSAHLSGPEGNFPLRCLEIRSILANIQSYCDFSDPNIAKIKKARTKNDIIITGDLNLHHEFENSMLTEIRFVDLWDESRDGPGYTWDPKENPLINIRLPFDNRRMRLDRILLKENCSLFGVDKRCEMGIFGQEKVFKWKWWSYLRPSDHYGISIRLALQHDEIPPPKRSFNTGKKPVSGEKFRTPMEIIAYRFFLIFLIIFILFVFFLKIVRLI